MKDQVAQNAALNSLLKIEKEKLKNQKEKEEREQYEKMLKEGFIEESEEEEELPDIQDSYYRD